MKKIELIREILEKKKAEEKKFDSKLRGLKDKRTKKLTEEMASYFSEVLTDPDGDSFVEISGNYIYFKMKHEDYSYPKEILSLSLRGESFRDDDIDRIETGFYSTTENSIFELNRMVVIGKVGQILLDYSDDIIACWNKVVDDFKKDISKTRKALWAKEAEVRDIEYEIKDLERIALKDKLLADGIEFTEGITLGARWNWDIRNVMGIKVTRVTPSGKSYDLELQVKSTRWNENKKDYVEKIEPLFAKAVKAYNVDTAVSYNKERIKS
jgi:hypothetical protein